MPRMPIAFWPVSRGALRNICILLYYRTKCKDYLHNAQNLFPAFMKYHFSPIGQVVFEGEMLSIYQNPCIHNL